MRTLLLLLFSFIVTLKDSSQNTLTGIIKNDSITKEWITALNCGNTESIDSLIETKTNFPLLQAKDVDYWNVSFSEIKNSSLSKIYYYCLNRNRDYANRKSLLEYYHKANQVNLYYREGDTSQIFGDDIYTLNSDTANNYKRDFEIEEQKNKAIADSLNSNLRILNYIIQKRKNIREEEAQRMVYAAGGDEGDWSIEPLSFLYFYNNIYPHPELFSPNTNLDQFSPITIFRSYVAIDRPNNDVLTYLLNNIDKEALEEILPLLYPARDTDEWDRELTETIPSYRAETVLMKEYSDISKYSGYNLLHAAIVNIDLNLVKKLALTSLMQEKTQPIHSYFYSMYGDKPLLPLKLAIYKQKQWMSEYSLNKSNQRLPLKFRLEQIRKIINCLKTSIKQ